MTKTISETLAEFVNEEYESIPKETIALAKLCILDLIGVTLAASAYPFSEILRTYLRTLRDFGKRPQSG